MLVSVIIPCYNVERYISECIDSVIAQTYSEIEIICVDNNSTDQTFSILENLKDKYSGKIIVAKELKKGASAARNKGLSLANGDWIQFLDADDLLLPTKIEHQVQFVMGNKDIAFVAAGYLKCSISGKTQTFYPSNTDSFKSLFVRELGITSANFFHKDSVISIGGWNEKLKSSQEADLMFRLLKMNDNILIDDHILTKIQEREYGQISQINPMENWVQFIKLRIEMIEYLKKERSDYFAKEKEYYFQSLFIQIRILSKYDLNKATELYNQNFKNNFTPKSSSKLSKYSFLFKLLGFRNTEILRGFFENKFRKS